MPRGSSVPPKSIGPEIESEALLKVIFVSPATVKRRFNLDLFAGNGGDDYRSGRSRKVYRCLEGRTIIEAGVNLEFSVGRRLDRDKPVAKLADNLGNGAGYEIADIQLGVLL